jgi:hypothetical protein
MVREANERALSPSSHAIALHGAARPAPGHCNKRQKNYLTNPLISKMSHKRSICAGRKVFPLQCGSREPTVFNIISRGSYCGGGYMRLIAIPIDMAELTES